MEKGAYVYYINELNGKGSSLERKILERGVYWRGELGRDGSLVEMGACCWREGLLD